jgi:hypothetical protein
MNPKGYTVADILKDILLQDLKGYAVTDILRDMVQPGS